MPEFIELFTRFVAFITGKFYLMQTNKSDTEEEKREHPVVAFVFKSGMMA